MDGGVPRSCGKFGVFICYRREDAAGHAGRLNEALLPYFGDDGVFMDLETIRPGSDFDKVIDLAIKRSDVLLALIGRRWLTCSDDQGRRRLAEPSDFVRLELETGLRGGIPIIPVLVDDARMPTAQELPPSLSRLAHKQAFELSNRRWRTDVGQLIAELRRRADDQLAAVSTVAPAREPHSPGRAARVRVPLSPQRIAALVIAIVAVLGAVLFGIVVDRNDTPPSRDWVTFTFNEQPLGKAQATRRVTDQSGNESGAMVLVDPPGEITVFSRNNVGDKAVKFPDPCMPAPPETCPRAIAQTADPSDLNAGGADFTYGADVLVHPAEAAPGSAIMHKGRPFRTDESIWKLQLEPAGRVSCVVIAAGSGNAAVALSKVSIDDGRWHHVKCTRAGDELIIEVGDSGPVNAELPDGLRFEGGAPLRLGGNSTQQQNDQYFGSLDNVFFRLGSS